MLVLFQNFTDRLCFLCFPQNESLSRYLDILLKDTQAPETHCLLIDRGAGKSVAQILRYREPSLIDKALKLITMWVVPNPYIGSYLDQEQAVCIWDEVVKLKRERSLLLEVLPQILTLFSSIGMPVVKRSVTIIDDLPQDQEFDIVTRTQIMSLFAHTGSYTAKQQERVCSFTTVGYHGRESNVQHAFDYFRRCPTGKLDPSSRSWIRGLVTPPPPGPPVPHRTNSSGRHRPAKRSGPVQREIYELPIELQELAHELLRAYI